MFYDASQPVHRPRGCATIKAQRTRPETVSANRRWWSVRSPHGSLEALHVSTAGKASLVVRGPVPKFDLSDLISSN